MYVTHELRGPEMVEKVVVKTSWVNHKHENYGNQINVELIICFAVSCTNTRRPILSIIAHYLEASPGLNVDLS